MESGRLIEASAHPACWSQRVTPGVRFALTAVIAWPVVGLIHELLVLVVAALLPIVAASWPAGQLVRLVPINQIYAQAWLDMAGTIDPVGLAVPSPLGGWLHAALPGIFVPPDAVAMNHWVAAVIAPGSTLPAQLLVSALADAIVLALGLGLMLRTIGALPNRERAAAPLAIGLIVQLVVVASELRAPLTAHQLEAAGALPFLYHEVLHLPAATYVQTFDFLTGLQPVVSVLGVLGDYILAAGFCAIGAVLQRKRKMTWLAVRSIGNRLRLAGLPSILRRLPSAAAVDRGGRYAFAAAIMVALVATPVGDILAVETRFLEAPDSVAVSSRAAPDAGAVAVEQPDPEAAPAGPRREPVIRRPVAVRVAGRDGRFACFVGGQATSLRAMGYNVVSAGLPADERTARYERDFAALRDLGVDAVAGWQTAEFDELLLDAAARTGLGVIVPFELDPAAQYQQAAVREAITSDVLNWVERYRRHPAVRMWAIGNETLMLIKDGTRRKAFAEFYSELVPAVLSADPAHPVLYRDAEDVYLPPLQEAMTKRGGPPAGFVYGMNFYTFRLKDVLAEWPKKRFDVPVMVSEFAPAGFSRHDRPEGFRRMWNIIQTHRSFVVGAAPYVWSTEGPEPVDRLFGFVDPEGRPLDGTVNTLRELYRGAGAPDAGTQASVPPLVGLTEAEAVQVLGSVGLAIGPTEYLARQAVREAGLKARALPGRVFAQQPAAGTSAAPDLPIRLTVIAPEPATRPGRFAP